MCALTIAPPSPSQNPPTPGSWAARAARFRIEQKKDARVVPLCFRDLCVSVEDLTTVKDAFAECSAEGLLQAVMRHEAGWRIPIEAVGSRAHHMLAGKIGAALETMRSLEDAVVELIPSQEGIIGPHFRFVADAAGSGLRPKVEAAMFSRGDADIVRGYLASGMKRVCTWDELRTLRCGGVASSVSERYSPEVLAGTCALLSHMPWERVLALPLWLPSDLNAVERDAILAKVFWSMTYRGFTPEAAKGEVVGERLSFEGKRTARASILPWPTDPVLAVLEHNCWVDTLQAWDALFAVISPSETRP